MPASTHDTPPAAVRPTQRKTLRTVVSWGALVALTALVGCAAGTLQDTPRQAYVRELGHGCNNSTMHMSKVDADGRYWVQGAANVISVTPYFDCMKEAQRRLPYATWLAGRTSSDAAPAKNPSVAATPVRGEAIGSGSLVQSIPVWRRGDEWSYRWESPQGKGTFVWAVDREEVKDGTAFYVIKASATRELYFRKSDLAYYMDTVNGQVENVHVPPSVLVRWPLEPGNTWDLRYTRERPLDRTAEEKEIRCESASGSESITVPAGTFETIKVTCRDMRTGSLAFEFWPSTTLKFWVRERTYLSTGGVRERELTAVKLGR